MTDPKRHHWWPLAQSKYWVGDDEKVYVIKSDGSFFKANPLNIGVESELYTRFVGDNLEKDVSIEKWFASEVDGRIKSFLNFFENKDNIRRRQDRGRDAEKDKMRPLGFLMRNYIEYYQVPDDIRWDIACYVAASLVRHPNYLKKLVEFYSAHGVSGLDVRNSALENMGQLYGMYREYIFNSTLILLRLVDGVEYLFSDGGITVQEPWDPNSVIPFDVHAPLTPSLALQVFPTKRNLHIPYVSVFEGNKQLAKNQNRIALADAQRFVFSRSAPPTNFVKEHFGVPAPKVHGFRLVDGKFETIYDPGRSN